MFSREESAVRGQRKQIPSLHSNNKMKAMELKKLEPDGETGN